MDHEPDEPRISASEGVGLMLRVLLLGSDAIAVIMTSVSS